MTRDEITADLELHGIHPLRILGHGLEIDAASDGDVVWYLVFRGGHWRAETARPKATLLTVGDLPDWSTFQDRQLTVLHGAVHGS